MGPQIMLSMVMHRDLPRAKIGCSKLSLIDALGRLCLPVFGMCPYPGLKMKQQRRTWLRWKQRDVLLKVFFFFCASGFLIKESTISISLEIYRILTAFSFFSVHLLWHGSISVLRMLFSLFSLRHQDYIMARRRMHSLYIQWMPQWNGMKNSCFSVTKSAAFMHPRAWHSWALGTSRGVLWTWNIFFYVPFFSLCSLCLFLSPLSSNGFSLMVSSGPGCSLSVCVSVGLCTCECVLIDTTVNAVFIASFLAICVDLWAQIFCFFT